jgi:hypothetical protein
LPQVYRILGVDACTSGFFVTPTVSYLTKA